MKYTHHIPINNVELPDTHHRNERLVVPIDLSLNIRNPHTVNYHRSYSDSVELSETHHHQQRSAAAAAADEVQGTTTSPNDTESSSLLNRTHSFLSANRDIYIRHVSLEILNPTHSSDLRKSSISIATFNLVATVCGGGVLSLPLAFSIAGIIPAIILMLLAAAITNFSLYILCCCARRSGGKSYADVARVAFGPGAEIITTKILFLLLGFILIAYMVLVKDIWSPIVLYALPALRKKFDPMGNGDDDEIAHAASAYVLVVLLIIISPLLLKRDLYALRHTCYVGFSSLVVLSVALMYRSWDVNSKNPELFKTEVLWYSKDPWDWVYTFPIIGLSFLSSFNVLSVHGSLVNPTRRRMKAVIDTSVSLCFIFFLIVGLCGYLYAYKDTKGDIILNFDLSDEAILFGRVGYAMTLIFGIPLVLLPAREALLSMPDQYKNLCSSLKKDHSSPASSVPPSPYIVNGVNFDEERPLLTRTSNLSIDTYNKSPMPIKPPRIPIIVNETDKPRPPTFIEYIIHVSSTFGIVAVAYTAAIAVPGVATVWSICGSSLSLIVAFVIPSACYLKIRARKGWNVRSVSALGLLIFSNVAIVVCTAQSISKLV